MPTYNVTCSWSYAAVIEIEADSEEEAAQIAMDDELPEGNYVGDSFQVDFIEEAQS